jgi:polyferredoxin
MYRMMLKAVIVFLAFWGSITPLLAQSLTGGWLCGSSGWQLQMILQGNGRYETQNHSPRGDPYWMSGSWQVFGNPIILRLNIEKHLPNQFCGPLGCSPTLVPAAEMYKVFPQGQNSFIMIGQNNARWACRRTS